VSKQFDVIIVGGGLAGATMALALAPLSLSIAVIEVHPYQQGETQPSFDDRCLALSYSSRQIYKTMGLWAELDRGKDNGFAAIKRIHVSDQGHWGVSRIDHKQEGVEALGYVVESRILGQVLVEKMGHYPNITLFCPARIKNVDTTADNVIVDLTEEKHGQRKQHHLTADLLIISDGVNSQTRERLGIRVNQRSYAQTAIIANIETELPHRGTAYERFTPSGPLAVLPLSHNRCSLVWTARDDQVDNIMAMDDEIFGQALQQRFGYRLGGITKVGRRVSYPLSLMTIDKQTLLHRPRIALVGNAAHGVHPVAGQGFNLGLRDIAALAELIADECDSATEQGIHRHADYGKEKLIKQYWARRQADIRQVTTVTDKLVKLFSNNSSVLAMLRNSGLVLADIITPLKHSIASEAMGLGLLQGKSSKMAVGQSIYKN
jgi:2-octaprenyl-6-methoxyphenol hydroxylase